MVISHRAARVFAADLRQQSRENHRAGQKVSPKEKRRVLLCCMSCKHYWLSTFDWRSLRARKIRADRQTDWGERRLGCLACS